jgi:hypothetical protein
MRARSSAISSASASSVAMTSPAATRLPDWTRISVSRPAENGVTETEFSARPVPMATSRSLMVATPIWAVTTAAVGGPPGTPSGPACRSAAPSGAIHSSP